MNFKQNIGKNMKDVVRFGQILSIGFMIAGYAFGGVLFARWLERNEFSAFWVSLAPVLAVCVGLWQGWLFVRSLLKK